LRQRYELIWEKPARIEKVSADRHDIFIEIRPSYPVRDVI